MRWTLIVLLAALLLGGCAQEGVAEVGGELAVAEALGGSTEGYEQALEPRPFVFPADHGPHPSFKTEWWYYTGNLATESGARYGYQLTFFRIALAPEGEERTSEWGARQIYMAHFALSDISGERFFAFERFNRPALGLAGAQAQPFRVWLEGWEASGPDGSFPMRLQAAEGGVALDLTLEQGKPIVLQGEEGLSQKGPERGNASYYYSLTRMPTTGSITIDGERAEVSGLSWMDREWSTSLLSEDQVGWDWFSLQLSDETELMYFQLRRSDGTPSGTSSGTLVLPDGEPVDLAGGDVSLEVLETWESDGVAYPSGWLLRAPGRELRITPAQRDQELRLTTRYWEGAVDIEGTADGQPITGSGYVELTGYGETGGPRE